MRTRAVWRLGFILATAAGVRSAAQEPLTLASVLARAGEYVVRFQQDLSGVVAEEHYTQDVVRPGQGTVRGFGGIPQEDRQHRDLRSDLLLVRPERADRYIQFRDVFEVDGKPVRDRDDRLTLLFLSPSPSASEQLAEIAQESARYNIGNISRDLNVPVLALMFLQPDNQPRFRFTPAKIGAPGQPWEIEYREVRPQTLIRTTADRDLPSRGKFRIEPLSGRVLMSELIAENDLVHADIIVTYQFEPTLGFLVPDEMRESISTPRGTTDIKGRATYSRFRQFKVTVEDAIVPGQ
jgi:hypothetical protein